MGASIRPEWPDPLEQLKALRQHQSGDDPLDQLKALRAATPSPAAPRLSGSGPLGALASVTQGMLGGFADEIGGAGAAAIDAADNLLHGKPAHFAQQYETYRDQARGLDKDFATVHPAMHAAAEIAGSVPTAMAVPLGGAARGVGLGGRILRGALGGASASAVYGAGNAEGDLSQRARGAGGAVLPGALIGAAVPAVGALAGAGRGLLQTATGVGSRSKALSRLGEIAEMSGKTPDAIAQSGTPSATDGAPLVMADLMGDPGRKLAQWTVGQPSGGGAELLTNLRDRNVGQYDRLISGTKTAMGQDFANIPQTEEALLESRRAAAAPAYAEAYAKGPVMTPTLKKALQDPDFAKAIAKGRALKGKFDIANGQDVPASPAPGGPMTDQEALYAKLLHLNGNNADAADAAMRVLGTNAPAPRAPSATGNNGPVPIDVLDYAKRYLDNGIRRGFDAQSTFDHSTATATNSLLGKVLDEVDAQVPEYAKARALYHSDSKMLEALEVGKKGLSMPPDEFAAAVKDMSPAEREIARTGFMDAFKQKASNIADRNDLSKQFLQNPAMRQRFQQIAPNDQAFEKLTNVRDREAEMARTLDFAQGGSNTADKQAMQAAMNGGISASDIAVLPISPHRTMARLAGRYGQMLQAQGNIKLADELGPMLATKAGTPEFDALAEALRNAGLPSQAAGRQTAKQQLLARLLGGGVGRSRQR